MGEEESCDDQPRLEPVAWVSSAGGPLVLRRTLCFTRKDLVLYKQQGARLFLFQN